MSKKIYPTGYTDEELKEKICEMSDRLDSDYTEQIIKSSGLISLAQSELQIRQADKMRDSAIKNEKSAMIFNRWSIAISIAAFVITVSSWHSSGRWEKKQLGLLEKLHETSVTQTKHSDRILKLEQDKMIQQ